MSNSHLRLIQVHAIRSAAALLAGLVLAGAALAEPNNGGGDAAKADCLSRAALQFSVDMAQCSGYPAGSNMSNYCQSEAASRYSLAVVACSSAAASPARASSLGGPASGPARPGAGGFGKGRSFGPGAVVALRRLR